MTYEIMLTTFEIKTKEIFLKAYYHPDGPLPQKQYGYIHEILADGWELCSTQADAYTIIYSFKRQVA